MDVDDNQVGQLEQALLRQAQALAQEQDEAAEAACARIEAETAARLKLREEREILLAKAEAERFFRQQVQAEEVRLAGEVDRLRWTLAQTVLSRARARLVELTGQGEEYAEAVQAFLAQAAALLPDTPLVAELSPADRERLRDRLSTLAARAAPGREISWRAMEAENAGGLRVLTADGNVRVDHSFEGRIARLQTELARAVMERLFAEEPDGETSPEAGWSQHG
jgi:V/A-type H+/Na+-transporting ATPase subunit E